MNEFLKSLKNDIERVYALWILNNMDLVSGYVKVKYTYILHEITQFLLIAIRIKSDELLFLC